MGTSLPNWVCAEADWDAQGSSAMRRFAVTLGLIYQIGGLIICSVLGSFFLGMWLDRRLGSAPCLMLVFMLVGLVAAVVGAYRLATKASE